ncbi:hypothetical protein W824_15190 [Clavibacter cf. michiganensis LMG 26808]|uniref:Uncharacterized protein n=1 Tax=Clavibacter michiganensis TaxID=28447 RepID=A0A399NVZ0_9MICO|nr:hypothetical protein W824_15190 [Clavibacter cf. michiganensis LMG 26808]RII97957.1 hypothetical protein DZF96_05105 [Clavibacter michiganensis]
MDSGWWSSWQWGLVKDAIIPLAAILIPTLFALWLARIERRAAARSHYLERRHSAAEGVILALAQMVSMNPSMEEVAPLLRDLRGRIAVYRASLSSGDVLSGDWLAIKHSEGLAIWAEAQALLQPVAGTPPLSPDDLLRVLFPGQRWAQNTLETLSGWLSGHVSDEHLRLEGSALSATRQQPSPG